MTNAHGLSIGTSFDGSWYVVGYEPPPGLWTHANLYLEVSMVHIDFRVVDGYDLDAALAMVRETAHLV